MWWLEIAVLAYVGLCCLARANHRYRGLPLAGLIAARATLSRLAGWILLGIALAVAVAALGLAQGIVAFLCLGSVVATGFTLLLSVCPRTALAPAILLPGTRVRRR